MNKAYKLQCKMQLDNLKSQYAKKKWDLSGGDQKVWKVCKDIESTFNKLSEADKKKVIDEANKRKISYPEYAVGGGCSYEDSPKNILTSAKNLKSLMDELHVGPPIRKPYK